MYIFLDERGMRVVRIVLSQNKNMKRGEVILTFHPRNEDLAIQMKQLIESKVGEIEVKDEYNNHFLIPLLNVYYFEVVEQKVFVYTKYEVYRVSMTFRSLKKLVSNKGFIQINVRTIINERHVYKYELLEGCHRKIILDNMEKIISNRQFKDNVDEMLVRRNAILQHKIVMNEKNSL